MRILILTPYLYDTAPGPRTSIELWEQVLKPIGITFEYVPFETDRLHDVIYQSGQFPVKATEMMRSAVRRIKLMGRLNEFDAVLIYREAALFGPAVIERFVALRNKPIIYQLDDPLYIPYRSQANGYLSYLKCFGKVKSILRRSSVVIVNSPQHRDFAAQFNDNVWEIPSVIDQAKYHLDNRPGRQDKVCVGWSGSESTVKNLQVIEGVLHQLAARPDVTFKVIGTTNANLRNVDYEATSWRAETEVSDLATFDVGLVPLPRDEWTIRKFYLKLVQYMALGIPPVATPIGANPSVIDHGRTGFLVESAAEWLETTERLIDQPDLRKEIGSAAAEVAAEKYTLSANADKIVAAFQSI